MFDSRLKGQVKAVRICPPTAILHDLSSRQICMPTARSPQFSPRFPLTPLPSNQTYGLCPLFVEALMLNLLRMLFYILTTKQFLLVIYTY